MVFSLDIISSSSFLCGEMVVHIFSLFFYELSVLYLLIYRITLHNLETQLLSIICTVDKFHHFLLLPYGKFW